jgi:hypothetical protein
MVALGRLLIQCPRLAGILLREWLHVCRQAEWADG